jgi:hypothetical protein
MGIKVVTEFTTIDTVKVWAYVYDTNDALADPDAITIDIYDPDSTQQVDGEAMTKSDTGIYYYYYHKGASAEPMAKGRWRGTVIVTDGSGTGAVTSTQSFSFKVK